MKAKNLEEIIGCSDSDKRFVRGVFGDIGSFFRGARYHAPNIFHIFSLYRDVCCRFWVSSRPIGGASACPGSS